MSLNYDEQKRIQIELKFSELEPEDEPIDTSNKVYLQSKICGFSIRYEPDVFDACPGLREALETDFNKVSILCKHLKTSILIHVKIPCNINKQY